MTTLPSAVCEVRMIPPRVELSVFDFSRNPLDKECFMEWLENHVRAENVKFMITYRCPYIIPSRIIDSMSECVNIHPLELPRFAGLNPWERFKESGMDASEAVLHRLDYIADAGEIIMREPFSFTSFSEARHNADCAAAHLLEKYYKRIADL